MAEIQVDSRRVWCGSGGIEWQDNRPWLLFLHGAGNDHSVWALQARSFGQMGWNVVATDFPGHGLSEDNPELSTITAYAEWVGRLADALGIGRCAVVGHSMGACVALEVAAQEHPATAAVGLVGAGLTLPVNRGLLDDTLHRPHEARRFITAFGHGRGSHFGGAETPGLWLLGGALALLERCPPTVLHRDFAACNAWNGEAAAANVSCEALIVSADGDRMTPPVAGRALAATLDGARFELLPDCGHMMMAERPTRLTQALAAFLAKVSTKRRSD